MSVSPHSLSSSTEQRLIMAAREAATHAYVPYSGFPVGAAVFLADDQIVTGVNIENASYGLTVCGERVAIFMAAADGHRTIRAIAISAPRADHTAPCGACRQVMNEFKPRDTELPVLLDGGTSLIRTTLSALLPDAFGPRDLARAT